MTNSEIKARILFGIESNDKNFTLEVAEILLSAMNENDKILQNTGDIEAAHKSALDTFECDQQLALAGLNKAYLS